MLPVMLATPGCFDLHCGVRNARMAAETGRALTKEVYPLKQALNPAQIVLQISPRGLGSAPRQKQRQGLKEIGGGITTGSSVVTRRTRRRCLWRAHRHGYMSSKHWCALVQTLQRAMGWGNRVKKCCVGQKPVRHTVAAR